MATDPLCFLCGLPADRGPYVLRLDAQHADGPHTRAWSRGMMVCCLCDTSPTLLEQLARKVSRDTYPTRGVQMSFTHALVELERLPRSFRKRATEEGGYCTLCQKFADEWPAPIVCEGPHLLRPHPVPCTWCSGQGFQGTVVCIECHGTGREA